MEKVNDPRIELFFKWKRDTEEQILVCMLESSWNTSPLDTLKIIFHSRDCRGGKGERLQFTHALRWLSTCHRDVLIKNIKHIPFYGKYKDLNTLFGTSVEEDMIKMFCSQLQEDKLKLGTNQADTITLAAKYAPSEGLVVDREHKAVKKICENLQINKKSYRKDLLVPLRSHLQVLERNMNEESWDNIDLSKVPSLALKKYKKALEKHIGEKYNLWINRTKINKPVYPFEIVNPYLEFYGKTLDTPDAVLEASWTLLMANFNSTIGNDILPIIDTSPSMFIDKRIRAIDVAISSALIISEMNGGTFHNKFMTFSQVPVLDDISGRTLLEKVNNMKYYHNSNINLQEILEELLTYVMLKYLHVPDMPKSIIIFSDREFDHANTEPINWELIYDRYASIGYDVPCVVFWNLNGTQPEFFNNYERKLCCINGFSMDLLNLVLERKEITPMNLLRKTIDNPRYDRLVL